MKKIQQLLGSNKTALVALCTTFALLILAFVIFNSLSVPFARRWDIQWGYYSILVTFILLVVGVVVNIPYIYKNVKGFLPSGKSFCWLAIILAVFSIFMFSNISNTHRVLSDETSWESMGLQMYFEHSGGICNEGV